MIPVLLIYQCSTYHQKPWIQKFHFIKVLLTIINTKFRNCILSRFLPSEALNSEIETLDGPQGELLGSGSPQCQAFPKVVRPTEVSSDLSTAEVLDSSFNKFFCLYIVHGKTHNYLHVLCIISVQIASPQQLIL